MAQLSAALCRSCHNTLLRRSAPQKSFSHATGKTVTRTTPHRLDRRVYSQQTSATAAPAGLFTPPWTDSEDQKRVSERTHCWPVLQLGYFFVRLTPVLLAGIAATAGQNDNMFVWPAGRGHSKMVS